MTTEAADSAEAVGVAPAADPGFLLRYGASIEYILIPGAALVGALAMFGLFVALHGKNPLVRHLVLLAEHADPRGTLDPDRAVHSAAGAARHGHHRR